MNFAAMTNGELVARMNTLVAQLNVMSVEVARRLKDGDFDTVDQAAASKAGYSQRLINGRFIMDVEDIELDPPDDEAGSAEGSSVSQ